MIDWRVGSAAWRTDESALLFAEEWFRANRFERACLAVDVSYNAYKTDSSVTNACMECLNDGKRCVMNRLSRESDLVIMISSQRGIPTADLPESGETPS